MGKSKIRNEFLLLLATAAFGVGCLLSESGADALILDNESLSVSFYSNLLAGILLGVVFLRVLILMVKVRGGQMADDDSEQFTATFKTVLFTMAVAVFHVLGIEYIGFYTCTLASLFIMYMNFEQWSKRVLLQAVIFSASLCVIFAVSFKYLKVFLPSTPLP